jgi:hypothetical protein
MNGGKIKLPTGRCLMTGLFGYLKYFVEETL